MPFGNADRADALRHSTDQSRGSVTGLYQDFYRQDKRL
jgi:hypothetical protein